MHSINHHLSIIQTLFDIINWALKLFIGPQSFHTHISFKYN
jgi:hypothetical protein